MTVLSYLTLQYMTDDCFTLLFMTISPNHENVNVNVNEEFFFPVLQVLNIFYKFNKVQTTSSKGSNQ